MTFAGGGAPSAALPVEKRDEMIARVELLMRAVKQAREEANMVEVPKHDSIGKKVYAFVLDGTL